jgi:hypothetical protein
MRTFIYASRDDPDTIRLDAVVRSVIPTGLIERFSGLAGLENRLRTLVEPDSIAVLFIMDRMELERMQRLIGLLTEIYVIMVIPDGEPGTLALAHLLLPRYISRKNSDFADLRIVLAKMYTHAQVLSTSD